MLSVVFSGICTVRAISAEGPVMTRGELEVVLTRGMSGGALTREKLEMEGSVTWR